MYRAQILLADGQYENLSRIAKSEQRSVSDLAREVLGNEITRRDQAEEALRGQRLRALEAIAAERQGILERRGGRPVELTSVLSELRNERDGDLLEAFRGGR